ncbi:hypothetical protein FORC14_4030 [Vibrio parahaemolyticus]|nr:hypothetical protein FORC14_4030 [Vibrio parahaemolyticus]
MRLKKTLLSIAIAAATFTPAMHSIAAPLQLQAT